MPHSFQTFSEESLYSHFKFLVERSQTFQIMLAKSFKAVAAIIVGLNIGLADCRIGRSTQPREYNSWITQLRNPCRTSVKSKYTSVSEISEQNSGRFYEALDGTIKLALDQLHVVESEKSDSFECAELEVYEKHLPSLPRTPSIMNLQHDDMLDQIYQSGLTLLTHLQIIIGDRNLNRIDAIDFEDGEELLPCRGESEYYVGALLTLIEKIEKILCTLVEGATYPQRVGFGHHFKKVQEMNIHRYNSCTEIEVRDCLVLHEARRILLNFQSKFIQLMAESKYYLPNDDNSLQ